MYRTVFWTLWEREGGMIWENGIETWIISYKKQITSPGLGRREGERKSSLSAVIPKTRKLKS